MMDIFAWKPVCGGINHSSLINMQEHHFHILTLILFGNKSVQCGGGGSLYFPLKNETGGSESNQFYTVGDRCINTEEPGQLLSQSPSKLVNLYPNAQLDRIRQFVKILWIFCRCASIIPCVFTILLFRLLTITELF